MDELAALVEELSEKHSSDDCFDNEHKAPSTTTFTDGKFYRMDGFRKEATDLPSHCTCARDTTKTTL